MPDNNNGITEDVSIDVPTALVITSFVVIALYNVIELNFIIFATFKTRRGLYFFSFIVATWGIGPYAISPLLKYLRVTSESLIYVTLAVIGWCCMVTGQSVVLYSRLHFVLWDVARLRLVLAMIIVDAVICHIPVIVMVYGANSSNPGPFVSATSIYEKVQVTIFFIQELIISGLYIYETIKLFRPEVELRGKTARHMTNHLLYVNAFIIILDITILGLEYSGRYSIQTSYKAFVYSIKLKLEFNILNRLVDLAQSTGKDLVQQSHPISTETCPERLTTKESAH